MTTTSSIRRVCWGLLLYLAVDAHPAMATPELLDYWGVIDAYDAGEYEIARETAEIYSPIAHRLGMGRMREQLDDLALRFAQPERYEALQRELEQRRKVEKGFIRRVEKELKASERWSRQTPTASTSSNKRTPCGAPSKNSKRCSWAATSARALSKA